MGVPPLIEDDSRVPVSRLMLCRLGKGTFAEVMRAVDVETGDLRAIKVDL